MIHISWSTLKETEFKKQDIQGRHERRPQTTERRLSRREVFCGPESELKQVTASEKENNFLQIQKSCSNN